MEKWGLLWRRIQNNSIEGKGKYFWTDGSRYVGEVKNSLREGQGIFVGPNNEATYEG